MRQRLILNFIAIENHSQFSCFVRYRKRGKNGTKMGQEFWAEQLIRRRGE